MLRLKYAFLMLAILIVAGCGQSKKEGTGLQQPAAPQQPGAQQPAQPPDLQQIEEPAQRVEQPAPIEKVVRKEPAVKSVRKETPPANVVRPPLERANPRSEPAIVRQEPPEVVPPVQTIKPEPQPPVVAQVTPAPPPRVQEPKYASIPQGTSIIARLQQPLDTSVNKAGDSFRATLDRDIVVDGVVVAPKGSTLEGKLTQVVRAGRVQGKASMTLQLVNLIIENQPYSLQTEILSFTGASSVTKDATKVGAGAGLGALIGALAGGGKGAAIGAAVGAGAGGAAVAVTRGDDLALQIEQKLNFALQRDVRVQIK
jgi:hypothetical protein